MESCKIHDKQIEILEEKMETVQEDLKHIRENVHTLLGRSSDFVVKVINGKTEERLASELIGEMYVEMKTLRKQTPKSIMSTFSTSILPFINILTLIGLIITLLEVLQ